MKVIPGKNLKIKACPFPQSFTSEIDNLYLKH